LSYILFITFGKNIAILEKGSVLLGEGKSL
jgi:hypothetical protein